MPIDRAKLDQIRTRIGLLKGKGEEATKQALVLPMLDVLGYDIWNPAEVAPEYDADFATKKLGQKEKVDLAILLDHVPRIYLEVKAVDVMLDGHEGQLARYFNATPSVSLAILTNGVEYRFFTDTAERNIMDETSFFTYRVESLDQGLDVLSHFERKQLAAEDIREYATDLNYTTKIVQFLREQLDLREREPTDNFVRWVLSAEGMYEGVKTSNVLGKFRPLVKNALQLVLRDVVRRSVAALDEGVTAPSGTQPKKAEDATTAVAAIPGEVTVDTDQPMPLEGSVETTPESGSGIVTTERELMAFSVISEQFSKSVLATRLIFDPSLRKEVPLELGYKDTQVYFGLYFNKPSWWFARLVLETKNAWISFNLPADVVQPLLPKGYDMLPAYAWAPSRVGIRGVDDLHALNRVIYAAMQAVIDARSRNTGDC